MVQIKNYFKGLCCTERSLKCNFQLGEVVVVCVLCLFVYRSKNSLESNTCLSDEGISACRYGKWKAIQTRNYGEQASNQCHLNFL